MKKNVKVRESVLHFCQENLFIFPFKDVATNGFLGKNFKKLLHKVKE